MNTKIYSDLDYITEVYHLFRKIASHTSIEELKKKMTTKYNIKSKKTLDTFDLVDSLLKDAIGVFLPMETEIQYYFSSLGEKNGLSDQSRCLADFILLRRDHLYLGTLSSLQENIQLLTLEKRCEMIAFLLTENTEESQSCHNFMDIIKYITESDFSNEEKWNIQQVILDKDKHQEILFQLYRDGVNFVKKQEKKWRPTIDTVCSYWETTIETRDIATMIHEKLNIFYEFNGNGKIIVPVLFSLNSLSISSNCPDEGEKNTDPDVIRIGVLFNNEFEFSQIIAENNYQEYICQSLKILSDKSKFDILMSIKDEKAYGSELAKKLGLTRATISYHMNALIMQGLVRVEKEDKKIFYTANKSALENILEYCSKMLVR